VIGSEIIVPIESMLEKSVTARVRFAAGTHRPIMFTDAGNTAASPRPSAMRAAISAGSEMSAAGGVNIVNADHHNTAAPRTILPPKRLASAPLAAMNAR
jgi:hypothetical protein